jgi:anion-transporting  ArsA/GET3 family ATPase
VVIVPLERCAASSLSLLLQRRVLFFVGKGGVGKTTVASAVAVTASRLGKKTLLIEIEEKCRAARLLGLPPMENATNILRKASPTLSVLAINGTTALEEYLQIIIPVQRLVRMLVESRPYQYFVAAAPGLKELLTIGKVWYEERKQQPTTQHPYWDLLIIDLPATGHGLQYLHMPHAAKETFSEGIVHREAERIETWLRDANKTAINLVTTAEELSINETLDAYQQLLEKLQLPIGALFINRAHEAPLSSATLSRIRPSAKGPHEDQQLAEYILACAQAETILVEEQEKNLRLVQSLSLPHVRIPFCSSQEFGPAQVTELSHHIEAALSLQASDASESKATQRGKKVKRST